MKKANIIKTSLVIASLLTTMSIYADTTMTTGTTTMTTTDDGTTTMTTDGATMTTSDSGTTMTTEDSSVDSSDSDNQSDDSTDTEDSTDTTSTTVSGSTSSEMIKKNREQIQNKWGQFHEEYGFIKQFLAKPTSKEEAKKLEIELKAVLKSYNESVKSLIKEGQNALKNNTFDKDAFNTKATEVYNKNIETLSEYIDPAKLEAFKKFMEAKRNMLLANKEVRIQNMKGKIEDMKGKVKDMKAKVQAKKQSRVSESLKKKLFAIIDKIPTEKRTEAINKVIAKIDVLTANTSIKEAKKQLLLDLKDLLLEKLNNTSTEDEILNEIIPADTTTTPVN